MLRLLIAFLVLANPAFAAEKVVAGLSQHLVSITANFDGTGIMIFGAVKREAPAPDAGPLQVIIAVAGPSSPVTVRRKARAYGIWVNTDSVHVDAAPSFYAVATTAPFAEVLSQVDDLKYRISIGNMIRNVGEAKEGLEATDFSDAVIRVRRNNGLYSENFGNVRLIDDTLFNTQIALPSNLTEGDYQARIFLTRDQKVVDEFVTTIAVRKVGMERWIYNLAHERPLVYGILSLVIAIFAGWSVSAIFRVLRLN